MAQNVEFLFDFGSPASYLAYKRLPTLTARTGARIDYVPILLGGVFKATGNASPATIPAKGAGRASTSAAGPAPRDGVQLQPALPDQHPAPDARATGLIEDTLS